MLILSAMLACGAQAAQVLEGGDAGETVMVLTRRLSELGFIAESVSEYDDSVASAIGDFQTANGLERTGIADIETQQLMNSSDAVTRQEYITGFAALYAGKNVASGVSGDDVRRIQQALGELGYYENRADGKFGEATRRAVVEYQRANGLEATGIADASMFLRLFEGESVSRADYVRSQCALKGDSGANVRAIQYRLNELGYFTGDPTGTYGDNTTRAVSRFQYDNELAQTGNVDIATYEALFAPDAAHADGSGVLAPGDTGDSVFNMQQRLGALGFYGDAPDGVFDRNTETAVMLFCAANGFEITVNVDGDMLTKLYSDSASDLSAIAERTAHFDGDGHRHVSDRAQGLVGTAFEAEGGLFPGFDFVRYVYAGCGIDVGDPSYAIERLGSSEDVSDDMSAGNVLVMGRGSEDSMVLCFAVCVDDGGFVYVNEETGVVEAGRLEDMQYTGAYVWKIGL